MNSYANIFISQAKIIRYTGRQDNMNKTQHNTDTIKRHAKVPHIAVITLFIVFKRINGRFIILVVKCKVYTITDSMTDPRMEPTWPALSG